VSKALTYVTWELGLDQAPHFQFADTLSSEERLLWSATLSSDRLLQRFGWGGIFFFCCAVFMFSLAPWGQTVAEYCASHRGSRCQSTYYLSWPVTGILSWFSGYSLYAGWRSRGAPWLIHYGLTTRRALMIHCRKHQKIRVALLERGEARIDWIGDVRVGRSRAMFAFPGLEDNDARRAVYWANEGRFRTDLSTGAQD
jgi:hypothetical protein